MLDDSAAVFSTIAPHVMKAMRSLREPRRLFGIAGMLIALGSVSAALSSVAARDIPPWNVLLLEPELLTPRDWEAPRSAAARAKPRALPSPPPVQPARVQPLRAQRTPQRDELLTPRKWQPAHVQQLAKLTEDTELLTPTAWSARRNR
jgi:hypothetical protein